jgi:CubicO group peptidase (beta-lactamase class C family)
MTPPQVPLSVTQDTAAQQFLAYHGASFSAHQQHFNDLYPKGWHMITLSVYGDLSEQLYAAVWVPFAVPVPWSAIHGATGAQYQDFFNKCASGGLHPILLSVAGSGSQTVFAGTCEPNPGPIPLTLFGLTSGRDDQNATIEYWNNEAQAQGWILTSGAIYGNSGSPLYAGIWSQNINGVSWNAEGAQDDATEYQARFDAETSEWSRPSFVTLSSYQKYLSVFVDDIIGPWVARHGLTSDQYQAEFDNWTKQGFYPISVQAGGFNSDARFAVLFAQSTVPQQRGFSTSGPVTVVAIDDAIKKFMNADHVRAATLGVVENTRLVYAKGYTWAESGYPQPTPKTLFRVASCSKTVTSIAIHQLIQHNLLSLGDYVQTILNLMTPIGGDPVDSRWNSITIEQLLEHKSGLPLLGSDTSVAAAFGVSLPVTKMQTARWMTLIALRNNPGAIYEYNNFNYMILSLVLEHKRGTTYMDVLASHINSPLGITDLRSSRSLVNQQLVNEARYYDSQVGVQTSVMSSTQPLVPSAYGAFNIENWDGFGGLSISAVAFARVLAALNTNVLLNSNQRGEMFRDSSGWDSTSGIGSGKWHAVKGGLISGLQSMINYNEGGIAYFIAWNKNDLKGTFYPSFPELEAAFAATSWNSSDLFNYFGLGSL